MFLAPFLVRVGGGGELVSAKRCHMGSDSLGAYQEALHAAGQKLLINRAMEMARA